MAQDAVGRVALQINREATKRWRDLIDLSRTPVIGLRRTSWHHSEECLIVGGLTAMRVRVRDQPREVASLHSRVERHLKRHSQRLDPFETCHVYRGPRRDPSSPSVLYCMMRGFGPCSLRSRIPPLEEPSMRKQHVVVLPEPERARLHTLIGQGTAPARALAHARILLNAMP
jgi:hypothetical protein